MTDFTDDELEVFLGEIRGELTRVYQVEALPPTAVIETRQGYVLERLSEGWYRPGLDTPYMTVYETWLPARVLRVREPEPMHLGSEEDR